MEVTNAWVKEYKSGKLLGFADVEFAVHPSGPGCLTISGFKIFADDDAGISVALPSKETINPKTKEKDYFPLVRFKKESEEEEPFMAAITEMVRQKLAVAQKAKPVSNNQSGSGIPTDDDIPF